jgi:WD40 repeat protein
MIGRIAISKPQLTVEWIGPDNWASGGADGVLYCNGQPVAGEGGPISCLLLVPGSDILISGSWDRSFKIWHAKRLELLNEIVIGRKILSLATDGRLVYMGCAEGITYVLNPSDPSRGEFKDRPFSYTTRCIGANQYMLATASYEGRVAIECFDNPDANFAFKAHFRDDDEGKKVVYPVNCVAFRGDSPVLASGGSDGRVILWDLTERRVLQNLGDARGDPWDTSIASMCWSPDGAWLVVAVSYCYEFGNMPHPCDRIAFYRWDG